MLKIISNIDENIIKIYKNYFWENFSNESIIVRYELKKVNINIEFDNNKKPIFKNRLFWSISHKKNLWKI